MCKIPIVSSTLASMLDDKLLDYKNVETTEKFYVSDFERLLNEAKEIENK